MLSTLKARRAELKKMYYDVVDDGSPATFIHLADKRAHRANFLSALLRDLPAVFTVIVIGANAVQAEHDAASLALAAAELITGAAVLITIGFEARHLFGRNAGHAGHTRTRSGVLQRIGAPNLAAAALGFVEAWHRTHEHHHFKLVSPQIVGAITSLLVGYTQNRPRTKAKWSRGLHVAVTPKGIVYLGGLRKRKWSAQWADVAGVEHQHGELAVRLHDGTRHVIRAEHHVDGDGILAQTHDAIAEHAPHIAGAASAAARFLTTSDASADPVTSLPGTAPCAPA